MKVIFNKNIIVLCVFLLLKSFAYSQSSIPSTSKNFIYSLAESVSPSTSSFTDDVLCLDMYDNTTSIFGLRHNELLFYRGNHSSISGSAGEYQKVKFVTAVGTTATNLFGATSQNPAENVVQSVGVYSKSLYNPLNTNISSQFLHGVVVLRGYSASSSAKTSNSFIHHFIMDTQSTNIYFMGDNGGSSVTDKLTNFQYKQVESDTFQISDAVITRVVHDNNFSPSNIRHNVWACGKGVILFFDGDVWHNFSSSPNSASNKSYTQSEFSALNKENHNIQKSAISSNVQYNSIFAVDSTIIYVGGNGGSFLRISMQASSGFFDNAITGNLGNTSISAVNLDITDDITDVFVRREPGASSDFIWLTTKQGKIYKAEVKISDGSLIGNVCFQYDNGGKAALNQIFILNNNFGYAVGDAIDSRINIIEINPSVSACASTTGQSGNNWKESSSLLKIFSLTLPQSSRGFNSLRYHSQQGITTGFIVGTRGEIIKTNDTVAKFLTSPISNESNFALAVDPQNRNLYVSNRILSFRPNSKDSIPFIVNTKWMVDSNDYISPYLPFVSKGRNGYIVPDCLENRSDDNDFSVCDESVEVNLQFHPGLIPKYPNYSNSAVVNPKYTQTTGSNLNKKTGVVPYVKRFASTPFLDNSKKPQNFYFNYKSLNYNFSLDTSILSLVVHVLGSDSLILRIKQAPFEPIIYPFSPTVPASNSGSYTYFLNSYNPNLGGVPSGNSDTIKTSVIGAFAVSTYPNYYRFMIDGIIDKSVDTTILRKSNQNDDSTLEITLTSTKNYINSNANRRASDTVYIKLTGPCKNDGISCPKDSIKILLEKPPLVLDVASVSTKVSGQVNKTEQNNYRTAKTFDEKNALYNDYTSEINDSIVFCQNGKLKNLITGSCYNTEDVYNGAYLDSFYTIIRARVGFNYKVFTSLYDTSNLTNANYRRILNESNKERYHFKMIENPNLVNEQPSVRKIYSSPGVFTSSPSIFSTKYKDTLFSSSCLDADTSIFNLKCNNSSPIEFRFVTRADSINRLPVDRVDTLSVVLEGYDNDLVNNESDVSIKRRVIKLLKIRQEAAKMDAQVYDKTLSNVSLVSIANTKNKNFYKFNNVASITRDTVEHMQLKINSNLLWELKFINEASGKQLIDTFDFANFSNIGASSVKQHGTIVDSGTRSIKFRKLDSNHTYKDWLQKVGVCYVGIGICDTLYAYVEKVESVSVKSASISPSNASNKNCGINGGKLEKLDEHCIEDTVRKRFSFTNNIYDSIEVGVNDSRNFWDIKLPPWLERDRSRELTPDDSGASKVVYLKTIDSNYGDYIRKGYIEVCKSFDRTLNDYPNSKDSACYTYFVFQDTPTLTYKTYHSYGQKDSIVFFAYKGSIDSLNVITEGAYKIETEYSALFKTLFDTSKKIKPLDNNTNKHIPSYNPAYTYGNSRLYFESITDNNSSSNVNIVDSFQLCLVVPAGSKPRCTTVFAKQNTPLITVKYSRSNSDTMHFKFLQGDLDSIEVYSDFPLDFRTYKGTWNDNTKATLDLSGVNGNSSFSISELKRNIATDTHYYRYIFSTKNRYMPSDKKDLLDSVRTCFTGQDFYCKVLNFVQYIPTISVNYLNRNNYLYLSHYANNEDSVRVISDGDWVVSYDNNGTWDNLPPTNGRISIADKSVFVYISSRNTGNTIYKNKCRICVNGSTDYCGYFDIVQDTAKLNVSLLSPNSIVNNKISFPYKIGRLDSLKVEANDTIEIYSLDKNGQSRLNWIDVDENSMSRFKKISGNSLTSSSLIYGLDTGNVLIKTVSSNISSSGGEGYLVVKIKGTSISRSIEISQGVPFFSISPKIIYLKRRALEGYANVNINTNTGWEVETKLKTYDIKEVGGDFTLSYNNENNYDTLNSVISIIPKQDNESYKKFVDTIIIGNIKLAPGILTDTLIVIQDSAYLNFEFVPNYSNDSYPRSSKLDSSIVVSPAENTDFKVYILGNVKWYPKINNWGSSNAWSKPLDLDYRANLNGVDTNMLMVKAFQNNSPELVIPREDTVCVNVFLNGIEKTMIKFKIIQDPFTVPPGEDYIIFPVPVQDVLTIRSRNFIPDYKGKVYIYNMDGSLIAERNFVNGAVNFDFSNLNTGLYIIKIYDGNIYYRKVILKQ